MAKSKPIPAGYPQLTPYICVDGADTAIEFYKKVFGAQERMRMPGPDGSIMHAEMEMREGVVMMGRPGPDYRNPRHLGGATQGLYIYVDDVDGHFAQAKRSGAKVVKELTDEFYGDRVYGAEDPEGHQWFFAKHIRDVAAEDLRPPA